MTYLVNHSLAGELGVFEAPASLACRRGDRVVIRKVGGLEIGVVKCPATERHQRMLDGPEVGELLRIATAEDEAIVSGTSLRAQKIFDDGRRLVEQLALPLDLLDVEVSLDAQQVTIYFVRWAECDERPLVAALSKKYEALVALRDLALPAGSSGCGKTNCGSGSGGCTSCGTGGGCATGCGTKGKAREVTEYFKGLRQKMDNRFPIPLD
jgi:cell fate regulator YaaT (PSP1 superfamily)